MRTNPNRLSHPATTQEINYSPEELEFLQAIDTYKRANKRPYPTWREVLAVVRSCGWQKVAKATVLPVFNKNMELPPATHVADPAVVVPASTPTSNAPLTSPREGV